MLAAAREQACFEIGLGCEKVGADTDFLADAFRVFSPQADTTPADGVSRRQAASAHSIASVATILSRAP
ncbi:hypothetical protein CA85_50190 [Allorhodopirellula solitaria]|uniref:Uncharacterized protein n=1 Tax=Allorhodopirellula solitaria TaxID=2527987 RepID=A0A5C5WQ28_9BACT|nr:hypothetical protein CA85_50190 [Allorhodopirellula solitaria]